MRAALLLAAAAIAVLAAAPAMAADGRIAVGVAPGASYEETAVLVEQATGSPVDRTLEPIGAFVVEVESPAAVEPMLAAVPGVEYVEEQTAERRLAFEPNDPLAGPQLQWYLAAIRAFDFWPGAEPVGLTPVRVAVVDSGIDGSHPEFQGKIAALKSFVRGRADVDTVGHGTRVAGEIAAITNNGEGIAGVGFPVELVVAKVVRPQDGKITPETEAKAIQWAVAQGAKVINLSLGGDGYSEVEQAAIAYAYGQGAVVVAATGNTEPPRKCPSTSATYPATLPHVLGVGAVGADGVVPCFSNRDGRYNDLIAPGVGIISTIPLALSNPDCGQRGYSICNGRGTSYSAPLVSAAAALLYSLRGDLGLAPSQVMQLIQTTTAGRPNGGRNANVGNGLLNVTQALENATIGPLPPADAEEPNDDAGQDAAVLLGNRLRVDATIDWYDDPNDVYRVYLRAGRQVVVRVEGLASTGTLVLWPPGTGAVTDVTQVAVRSGRIIDYVKSRNPVLRMTPPRDGWYFVELKAASRAGYQPYRLTVTRP